MSQSQHLLRRNAVYYYRRRVPLPLVEKLGKKVVLFSLGTSDPKEAKKLRALHDLQWDARFEAARPGSKTQPAHLTTQPSGAGLIQLVQDYVERAEASQSLTDILRRAVSLVFRCEQVIPYRGIRAVIATECDVAIARMAHKGWADRGLEEACMQARRTSQCLLPVLLPLLKAATEKAGGNTKVMTNPTPEVRDIEGLPGYAVDGYTRPGRAALMTLARQDRHLARFLAPLQTAKARLDAVANLLFVVEGGVCTTELSDPLYDELKTLSQGCWAGLPKAALAEGLVIMDAAIPALNSIRADLGYIPIKGIPKFGEQ